MVSVRFQHRVNFYIVSALLKPYINDIMVSVRIQLSVNLYIDSAETIKTYIMVLVRFSLKESCRTHGNGFSVP